MDTNTRTHSSTSSHQRSAADQIADLRVAVMMKAIELDVDADDFRFADDAERQVWAELQADHERRLEKDDTIWRAA